jgi:hypothetical protein
MTISAIADFLDLMPDTVTFQPLTGTDQYAKPSYGNPVSVKARVVYEDQKTTDDTGQDVVAHGKIYLGGAFNITVKHRATLPDGTHPPIVRVLRYPDETGAHHEVVLFA